MSKLEWICYHPTIPKASSGDCRLLVQNCTHSWPLLRENIWPRAVGHQQFIVFPFVPASRSVFMVLRFLPQRLLSLPSGAVFSWSCAGFQAFRPPCVYLSVWTCSPGGIMGVGVLSGLIAVWCLVGRRAWLGRRWGKTCPCSFLSLSPPFCLSSCHHPPPFHISPSLAPLSDSLHDYTEW